MEGDRCRRYETLDKPIDHFSEEKIHVAVIGDCEITGGDVNNGLFQTLDGPTEILCSNVDFDSKASIHVAVIDKCELTCEINNGLSETINEPTEMLCSSMHTDIISEEKVHVALIDSSESEDEGNKLEERSMNENTIYETEPVSCCEQSEDIRNSQSIEIGDDVAETAPLQSSKYVHKLDYKAWLKLKKQKKIREKNNVDVPVPAEEPPVETIKTNNMAWVEWMCQKKNDEIKKNKSKLHAINERQKEKQRKDEKARKNYEEWVEKKDQQQLLQKQTFVPSLCEEKSKTKITRNVNWEEWHEQRKSQTIPKTASYASYPKPAWINPTPWKNPDSD